jgi:putative membrane protein
LHSDSAVEYQKLEKLSGSKFDAAYIKIMVTDHDKTVSAFEDASSKAKNPDLKAFVDKTLPVLRQHKDHIHEIASQPGKA